MDFLRYRRGQLSIFFIIGLLILIVFAIGFFMISETTEETLPARSERTPLETFVSGCIESTLEEATEIVGMNAGYIYTDDFQSRGMPLDSPYLSLYEDTFKLPYWDTQDEIGVPRSHMPSLHKQRDGDDSIESQIERYIEENIDSCLDGLSAFEERNMEVEIVGNPDAEVHVGDREVLSSLDYEIRVGYNDSVTTVDKFSGKVPVNLKRVYELARSITEHEQETAFLEENLINFVDIYSSIDSDYLPPMYGGMQIGQCSDREFWLSAQVEEDFRDMLVSNIPYIMIEEAAGDGFQPDLSGYDSQQQNLVRGVYKSLSTSVSETDYPEVRVDFSFMNSFPFELDFGTSFLEPQALEVDMFFAKYCIFEYLFYYSTRFPVLVTLYDDGSRVQSDDGYMFQFPLMLILDNNFPKVNYADGFLPEEQDSDYSCAYEQRISGDVIINVTDNFGEAIEDAFVTYRCGPEFVHEYDDEGEIVGSTRFGETCIIGSTDRNGILETRLPPCAGRGVLSAEHQDYTKVLKVFENIFEGSEYDFNIELDKLVELDLNVWKYTVRPPIPDGVSAPSFDADIERDSQGNVTKCDFGSSSPLQSNEEVIVRLEKVDSDRGMLVSSPFAYYRPGEDSSISLAPGKYRAELMLTRNEEYEGEMDIEKNSQLRVIDRGSFRSPERVRYPDEDLRISVVNSGGAEFEFEVTEDTLYDSSEVRFFVMDQGAPEFIENIGRAVQDMEVCSELNYDKIIPRFNE